MFDYLRDRYRSITNFSLRLLISRVIVYNLSVIFYLLMTSVRFVGYAFFGIILNTVALGSVFSMSFLLGHHGQQETSRLLGTIIGLFTFFAYIILISFLNAMLIAYVTTNLLSELSNSIQHVGRPRLQDVISAIIKTLYSDLFMLLRLCSNAGNILRTISHSNGLQNIQVMWVNFSPLIDNKQNMSKLTNGLYSLSDITPDISEMSRLSAGDLSDIELGTIESSNDVQIKTLCSTYNNLKYRMNEAECPILITQPERDEAMILTKQYQKNCTWLPVPNQSTLFDKESLIKLCSMTNPRHPTTRDSLQYPDQYVLAGTSYETRYAFHPYYVNETDKGVCQELCMMETELRERLASLSAGHITTPTRNNAVMKSITDIKFSLFHDDVKMQPLHSSPPSEERIANDCNV